MFSVVGALQAMMPLLASPMYGFLYKRTLATLPGAFLLLNVGLYVVVMFLVLWVYTRMRSTGVVGADMELTHGEELVGVTQIFDMNNFRGVGNVNITGFFSCLDEKFRSVTNDRS